MIYNTASKNYNNPNKVYVEVTAVFSTEGTIEPKAFVWEDGRAFEVDRVDNVCQAASRKAGGCGIRYTVQVRGKQTFLFLEENRWFMERK